MQNALTNKWCSKNNNMLLWTQLVRNTMCVFYCTNHKYILQLCSRNRRSKCTADKKSVSYFWTVFLLYLPWAQQLWWDVPAYAGFLCDKAAVPIEAIKQTNCVSETSVIITKSDWKTETPQVFNASNTAQNLLERSKNVLGFMNVTLLQCNYQYVSATHVAIFRVVRTEHKYNYNVSQ